MLRVTPFEVRCISLCLPLLILTQGCWRLHPPTWTEQHRHDNFMRFRIGVQEFESYADTRGNGGQTLDLDRLPCAFNDSTQSSIFAQLADREDNTVRFDIYLPSLQPGSYILSDSMMRGDSIRFAGVVIESEGRQRVYRSSPRLPTVINIVEFDSTRHILRGNFTMELELLRPIEKRWPSRLKIEDGVFEIRSIGRWDWTFDP
jgi:hypothetical protein